MCWPAGDEKQGVGVVELWPCEEPSAARLSPADQCGHVREIAQENRSQPTRTLRPSLLSSTTCSIIPRPLSRSPFSLFPAIYAALPIFFFHLSISLSRYLTSGPSYGTRAKDAIFQARKVGRILLTFFLRFLLNFSCFC